MYLSAVNYGTFLIEYYYVFPNIVVSIKSWSFFFVSFGTYTKYSMDSLYICSSVNVTFDSNFVLDVFKWLFKDGLASLKLLIV